MPKQCRLKYQITQIISEAFLRKLRFNFHTQSFKTVSESTILAGFDGKRSDLGNELLPPGGTLGINVMKKKLISDK